VLDLSPEKVLLLGIIALVVMGPNKLPQAARNLGHFVGQMRKMTSSFHSEVRDALGEPMDSFTSAMGDLHPRSVPGAILRAFDPPAPTNGAGGQAAPVPGGQTSTPAVRSAGDIPMLEPPDDPSLN
jgi:sec-independent protein translocase protein TatB